jgi:hypothetical protein
MFPLWGLLADPIGEIHIAGNTWRELQWPFNVEDMIALDTVHNFVYVVWTYSPNPPMDYRKRSYFNCFSPGSGWFFNEPGYEMFPGVSNQRYHSIMLADNEDRWSDIEIGFESIDTYKRTMRAWWAGDDFERMQLDTINFPQEIIVRRACDRNGWVHMLADGSRWDEDFGRLYYGRYETNPYEFNGWEFVDTLTFSAYKITASPVSDRVALIYHRQKSFEGPEFWFMCDNDVYLIDSPDGFQWDWQSRVNLTNFSENDIFRPIESADVVIDYDDQIHVAFTTRETHVNIDHPESISVNPFMCHIWHWSEAADSFSVAADGWIPDPPPGCNLSWYTWPVARPQMAINPDNGYLYLLYERNNCEDWSGYPITDLWVSVSTDNGLNWSVGTNITDTQTPDCIIGRCASEIQASVNNLVNDTLHVVYILDKAAGIWQYDEGFPYESDVVYQKIPADLIATEPLLPQFSIRSDPRTAVSDSSDLAIPRKISLSQNYPNPFNSATTIHYTIFEPDHINLSVYNLLGQKVETLVECIRKPGDYRAAWDAADLTSGIYIIKLSAGLESIIRKAILLK